MPLQVNLLEKVQEAKIFTKLDLQWGFNNICIKEGDKWKTAFRNKNNLYEYLVMPFGLKNAPAVFQRLMNHVLQDLIDVCVVVHLDVILVYAKMEKEHEDPTQTVLQKLCEAKLFLKLLKCHVHVTTITYIGIVILLEGVSMEKEKVKVVLEWKEPRKVKELQAFLGFANFYRQFVNNFSAIAKPLTHLTGKNVPWSKDVGREFFWILAPACGIWPSEVLLALCPALACKNVRICKNLVNSRRTGRIGRGARMSDLETHHFCEFNSSLYAHKSQLLEDIY